MDEHKGKRALARVLIECVLAFALFLCVVAGLRALACEAEVLDFFGRLFVFLTLTGLVAKLFNWVSPIKTGG